MNTKLLIQLQTFIQSYSYLCTQNCIKGHTPTTYPHTIHTLLFNLSMFQMSLKSRSRRITKIQTPFAFNIQNKTKIKSFSIQIAQAFITDIQDLLLKDVVYIDIHGTRGGGEFIVNTLSVNFKVSFQKI